MGTFVKKQEFKDLNVGFALDESSPSETEAFELNNGERIMWRQFYMNLGDNLVYGLEQYISRIANLEPKFLPAQVSFGLSSSRQKTRIWFKEKSTRKISN